jgi:hypothetical protein
MTLVRMYRYPRIGWDRYQRGLLNSKLASMLFM